MLFFLVKCHPQIIVFDWKYLYGANCSSWNESMAYLSVFHSSVITKFVFGKKLAKRMLRISRFHKRTILFGVALISVSLVFYLITVEIVTFILTTTRYVCWKFHIFIKLTIFCIVCFEFEFTKSHKFYWFIKTYV